MLLGAGYRIGPHRREDKALKPGYVVAAQFTVICPELLRNKDGVAKILQENAFWLPPAPQGTLPGTEVPTVVALSENNRLCFSLTCGSAALPSSHKVATATGSLCCD